MARTRRGSNRDNELSQLLLALRRQQPNLGQVEAANRAGITQSMLSRAENGRALLDTGTLRKLASIYHATPDERQRLLDMAEALAPSRTDSRLIMQRGNLTRFHDRIYKIEHQTALVRSYHPGIVLGMLQTEQYTRAIFSARTTRSPEEVASLVANRQRRSALLADPAREWVLIQTVGALDWNIGGPDVMLPQMQALADASRLPNVRLGIIPRKARATVFAPHGFDIYDQVAVLVGTKTATALTDNERDISEYTKLFAALKPMAAWGDPARAELEQLAAEYRELR